MQFTPLYQELTHSTETLRALLATVGAEEARMKPSKTAWSILEVICHLCDEEWHSIAPQAWVKLRHYNEQDFGKMKGRFFRERAKSLAWLKGLKNADWGTTYKSEWGAIRAGDMFASWVAHDNLHIRQLVELRRWHIEHLSKPYKIRYAGDW